MVLRSNEIPKTTVAGVPLPDGVSFEGTFGNLPTAVSQDGKAYYIFLINSPFGTLNLNLLLPMAGVLPGSRLRLTKAGWADLVFTYNGFTVTADNLGDSINLIRDGSNYQLDSTVVDPSVTGALAPHGVNLSLPFPTSIWPTTFIFPIGDTRDIMAPWTTAAGPSTVVPAPISGAADGTRMHITKVSADTNALTFTDAFGISRTVTAQYDGFTIIWSASFNLWFLLP